MQEYIILDGGTRVYYTRSEATGSIIIKPHVFLQYTAEDVAYEVFSDEVLEAIENRGFDAAAFYIYVMHRSEDVQDLDWLEDDEEYLEGILDNFDSVYVGADAGILAFFEGRLQAYDICPSGSDIESNHPLLRFVDWEETLRKYILGQLEYEYLVYRSGGYDYFFVR